MLRRARIGSASGLLSRNPPYPVGGIHGGHISIVWNAGGAGYVVTRHAVASPERADGNIGPRAVSRKRHTDRVRPFDASSAASRKGAFSGLLLQNPPGAARVPTAVGTALRRPRRKPAHQWRARPCDLRGDGTG